MSTAFEREKTKLVQERCQSIIASLLKDEDNKYCVDCDAKSPRWASWNLGIFLCIRCAGIHRNLGVHISKVKSVNLDSWTPQQVASIQQMGNSRARAVYEANNGDNFRRPQTDSSLEQFIRAKYEAKKYIAKEWVEQPAPHPNWEAEIEKQLRKKKEKKSSSGAVEFPATVKTNISKTSNISPKPLPKAPGGRNEKSSPNSSQIKRNSTVASNDVLSKKEIVASSMPTSASHSLDLLGLDMPSQPTSSPDNSDLFGDFLSAPIPSNVEPALKSSEKEKTNLSNIEQEESSFFQQTAPVVKTNEKLSKDSIMALYAKSPSQPAANVFGAPNGVYGSVSPGFMQGVNIAPNNQMAGMSPQMGMQGMMSSQLSGLTQQNVLNYQQVNPNVAMGGGYPSMPSGIQLSPANPFAQPWHPCPTYSYRVMQSQMGGLSLGQNGQVLQPNSGFPAQLTGLSSIPSGIPQMPNQQASIATNLWQ